MKIINVVVISTLLFLSVGFAYAETYSGMDDIVTKNRTPQVEFMITGGHPSYVCNLYINNTPSGVDNIYENILSTITCDKTLEVGLYEYYISAYWRDTPTLFYNSSCYTLQITSSWGDGAVEAIGYLGDGFQHIGDSTEGLMLWGIIFCVIVILLGMIGMFMKAIRG